MLCFFITAFLLVMLQQFKMTKGYLVLITFTLTSMHLKMVKNTYKILRCLHHKISTVSVAIYQHYA